MVRTRQLLVALGLAGLLLFSASIAAAREYQDHRPPGGAHPAHPGKPARPGHITWAPFRIVQQVAASQTVQVTASFVSSTELHDVRLVVPGGLGRLITATPTHFDTVAANTPTAVTFTIAMPAQHAHNQGGVVLVRSGQRVISQPLHVWVGVSGTDGDQGHPAPGHPKHAPHGPKGD
jgi:hypothetical protein